MFDAAPASGRVWRFVEAQHFVSTMKITDTLDEQYRLEEIIDASKPLYPPECRGLHPLQFTPFRYAPARPHDGRFRRAGAAEGVFYAAETEETAMAEMAFWRLLTFVDSPETPWPANPFELTAFAVRYETAKQIDLTAPPYDAQAAIWTHPTDYEPCIRLAETARREGVGAIRTRSARDPAGGANVALLTCAAFADAEVAAQRTWRLHLSASGAMAVREHPRAGVEFARDAFAGDPRIAALNWNR